MQEAETQFKVTKQDDGSVLLEHAGADSFTLTSDEAYALLDFLYKMRDDLASTVHQEDRQHIVHEFARTDQPAEQPAVENEYPVVPPGDSSGQAVVESQQTTREETLRAAEE